METTKRDLYAEVTGKIVASLEAGVVPWHQPWGFTQPAQNHFTAHRYRGVNSLLMLLGNYETPYFATIHQINEAGGKVKKGSKASFVYFHDKLYKDGNGHKLSREVAEQRLNNGDSSIQKIPYMKLFNVFNMADVEGVEVKPSSRINNLDNEPIPVCNDFLAALSPTVKIFDRDTEEAYFEKVADEIIIPQMARFESAELYYAVLFHELTHWTGHASRLKRPSLTDALKFGDTNYSKEELIAELGGCFLCNQHGINTVATHEHSTSYIDHWVRVLKKDKKFIWEVASDSQAAFNYLMQLAEA